MNISIAPVLSLRSIIQQTLLSQTLGHASVATTSKYLHAKPNDSSGLYLM
ncbi:MAG: hypothetical protein ACBR50_00005 [Microcoleus sp.]